MKDFYLMHYTYYFANSTEKGEGTLYLAATPGRGVRKADIEGAGVQVIEALSHLGSDVIVVPNSISYLSTCTEEEFHTV